MVDVIGAARQGNTELLTSLILDQGVDITLDFQGRTLIYYAAEAGKVEVVKQLIGMGADVTGVFDLNGQTPLFPCCLNGHVFVAAALIEAGCNVNHQDEEGRTVLSYAAQYNRVQVIDYLLSQGAEVDLEDSNSLTALGHGAQQGNAEVVSLLLKAGAAVNHVDSYSRTPLAYACRENHLECVQKLLDAGAATDVMDHDGKTAFSYALHSGNMDLLRLVCEQGAGVNAAEAFDNSTPLFLAVRDNNLELIYTLLSYGADVHHRDNMGRTALFDAVSRSQEIVTLLLMKGADVNAAAMDGSTPLMLACHHGNLRIVQTLLERGADIQMLDLEGKTAAAYATNDDVKVLLEERWQSSVVMNSRFEPLPSMKLQNSMFYGQVSSRSESTGGDVYHSVELAFATPGRSRVSSEPGHANGRPSSGPGPGPGVGAGPGTPATAFGVSGSDGLLDVESGITVRHVRDLETGDIVSFTLYQDKQLWERTAKVLRALSSLPQAVVTRLPSSSVVAGRAGQQDQYRNAVFENADKFPDTPYVIVTEQGDCALEDLAGQPTWQQPSRLAFVCEQLGQALAALQAQGLVHTNLCASNCQRFFDGSWRLSGAEQIHRLGDLVVVTPHWEICPPEHAAMLLEGNGRPVSVEGSVQLWALGALLYRLATGNTLVTDLSDGTATSREDCLSVLASLHKSPLGQSKVEALLGSMDQRLGSLRGPAPRIPRFKMVVDLLRRLLLRVENWQRCSVDKLLEHPLLAGHGTSMDALLANAEMMGAFPGTRAVSIRARQNQSTLWGKLQEFLELHWYGVHSVE